MKGAPKSTASTAKGPVSKTASTTSGKTQDPKHVSR